MRFSAISIACWRFRLAPPQSGRGKLLAPKGQAPKGQANTGVLYQILSLISSRFEKNLRDTALIAGSYLATRSTKRKESAYLVIVFCLTDYSWFVFYTGTTAVRIPLARSPGCYTETIDT